MKSNQDRLSNIAGQIEGVKRMMSEGKDCLQLLTQLKAIKSAVSGVMDTLVESEFNTCLSSLNDKDKKLLIKIKKYVQSN